MFTGIIQQHGTILESGARLRLRTSDPEAFARGESLAVNGVCLTVMPENDGTLVCDVSNETLRRTNIGDARIGDRVNLEFDMVAKYIRNLAAPYLRKA